MRQLLQMGDKAKPKLFCSSHRAFTKHIQRRFMQEKMQFGRVLLCQSVGFVAIILLSWLNEVVGLRSLVLGDHPYISDFRESTLEMLFVLAIWLIVVGTTRRLLMRVNHLEGFLRMCSWCRRVGADGRWVQIEEFLCVKFATPTSHGVCEECAKKQRSAHAAQARQKLLPLDLPQPKIAQPES